MLCSVFLVPTASTLVKHKAPLLYHQQRCFIIIKTTLPR
ncbi:unnamed protein product [Linum tenue]|uniref:Uncharacterized protein n=1 Tax=Linum tenue TaxID=586396 RepID=A0AAV0GXP7_9ROSI|nr:unnamed protein product [Linum tenue]